MVFMMLTCKCTDDILPPLTPFIEAKELRNNLEKKKKEREGKKKKERKRKYTLDSIVLK